MPRPRAPPRLRPGTRAHVGSPPPRRRATARPRRGASRAGAHPRVTPTDRGASHTMHAPSPSPRRTTRLMRSPHAGQLTSRIRSVGCPARSHPRATSRSRRVTTAPRGRARCPGCAGASAPRSTPAQSRARAACAYDPGSAARGRARVGRLFSPCAGSCHAPHVLSSTPRLTLGTWAVHTPHHADRADRALEISV